eukprot:GILJ01018645.1.p1 GENE.GILJ01018645.1~~GILJ01018645.1.p1  ORF type:complete len:249 (-),score=26.99 GILJ01018645.1:712-1458(-)
MDEFCTCKVHTKPAVPNVFLPCTAPVAACQLHFVGELDNERPVMVIATGSAAVLRALVFCIPDHHEEMERTGYILYNRTASLNDRKFSPILVNPMALQEDIKAAMYSTAIRKKDFLAKCIEHGYMRRPVDVQSSSNVLCYEIDESILVELALQSRGTAADMENIFEDGRQHQDNRIFASKARIAVMERLHLHWRQDTAARVEPVEQAAFSNFALQSLFSLDRSTLDVSAEDPTPWFRSNMLSTPVLME